MRHDDEIDQTHPDAYVDYPMMDKPTDGYPAEPDQLVVCPKCAGHGGWNWKLNAYKTSYDRDYPGRKNTAKARHLHLHARSSCGQCNGWGYVVKGSHDETCIHDWVVDRDYKPQFRCMHGVVCSKCGDKAEYDSSD